MKLLSILFLCALPFAAQTTSHLINLGTATTCAGSDCLIVSGGSSGTWSTGTMAFASGGAMGRQAETRKAVGPMPTLRQVKLTARTIPVASLAASAYLKMAMKIGLDSAATDEARVLDAIHQIDLVTYDYGKVDEYLYRQALRQGTSVRWVWKPMRGADKDVTDKSSGENAWSIAPGFGMLYPKLYAKAIPARVLETVASVMAKLPDAVFLVSDYEVVKPDPFLAVTTKKLLDENKMWIIDVLAEPGFTDPVPEMKIGPASTL